MILGLSSYTFGWAIGAPGHAPARPLDEHGLLDTCREHGIKLLQIGDNLPLHTFDKARLDRLGERAPREGVQLEVGARRLTLERVAEYAAIARRLNAKLIRFVIDDADYHPTPEAVSIVLRQCSPLLRGLTLGLENHDRFPAATLREMMESSGSDRIGVCLDTANSLGAGEGLDTVVRELGSRTVNLHVKDFQVARVPHLMGFTVEGRPAGEGQLDVPRLLDQLAPFDRCRTAVLELWTPPETDLSRTSVVVELAYAKTPLERECFPQTLAFVEGPLGSIEVTDDYWLRVTTKKGTYGRRHAPPRYAWADPRYDVAQSSMVACHRDLLAALRGQAKGETTGADNLKTLELVFGAYKSASRNAVLKF